MERDDTLLRPFKIIPGAVFFVCSYAGSAEDFIQSDGVHHWDENGLKKTSEEPEKIRQIHAEMIEFVKVWLEGWRGGEVYPQQ
jgi:hypothetical protein